MLSPKYNYIALDFETTGLDTQKDEAIQIGIAKFDHTGKLLDEYQTLLNPQKNIEELKNIVGFLTGINYSELINAPTTDMISKKVEHFFEGETCVIGHNIDFDLAFLTKYFPQIKYTHKIDTYTMSLQYIHFAPSYALEVLIEHLIQKEKKFAEISDRYNLKTLIENDEFHDALTDSKASFALFFHMTENINTTVSKYPFLQNIICKNHHIRENLLNLKPTWIKNIENIPTLEKEIAGQKTIKSPTAIDIKNLKDKERYFIGNNSCKKILTDIASNKHIILSFANRQKLDITKHHLQNIGIKNLWFAREEQILNYIVLKSFIQKPTHTYEEINFLLKYFSHIQKKLWFLDLNNEFDYKIYYFLKQTKKSRKYPIILSTHNGLFGLLEKKEETYNDYNIIFFDTEQRYKNYNQHISRTCDLYYILQQIETLVYTYDLRNQIKTGKYENAYKNLLQLANYFQIFIATIFQESQALFKQNKENKIEYNPIFNHYNFYKTSQLRTHHQNHIDNIWPHILDEDKQKLIESISQVDKLLNTLVTIEQRPPDSKWHINIIFTETNRFTNRDEFIDIFNWRKIVFFSNNQKQIPRIEWDSSTKAPPYQLLHIHETQKVVQKIIALVGEEKPQSIYILSSKKEESKNLFDLAYQKNLHKTHNIIVENITWWIGKSIFKIKENKSNIIIWGYNFLMHIFSKQKKIDIVVNFNIKWNLEQYFLDDISWYAPEKN